MRLVAGVAIVAALVLGPQSSAAAEFSAGARIVSISPDRHEQADGVTTAVDISSDGRYVAFQTRARNLFPADYQETPGQSRTGGIFRRDLAGGGLELVAPGDLTIGTTTTRGAQNPSISGDGRYVSFASADQLVAADINTRIDVYVRDMGEPITSPSAFELVSARDGGDQPAVYDGPALAVTGSQLPPESAISASGRQVVFGTQATSDLPAAELPATAPGQLFVRDLDAKTTTLVTRHKELGTPVGGANSARLSSAISADGSTVAWPGKNASVQTRIQPGEPVDRDYYLWRRVADGPAAQTRRITGAADVDDPACPETELILLVPTNTGPCYGPLSDVENFLADLPSAPTLSADGTKVTFLTIPPLRPTPLQGNQFDVFVSDMSTGLTRKASTIELTREVQSDASVNNISAAKISADGKRVAFVTPRREFTLPRPRLITPPPSTINKAELYVAYLDRMEIERVTTAWNGDEIDGPVTDEFGAVAMSAEGRDVAFVSSAANLFPGDANSAADAFVLSESGGDAASSGSGEPPFGEVNPREDTEQTGGPVLPVSLKRGPRGSVRVTVKAPQAGRLALTARARVRSGRRAPTRAIARARKRVRTAGKVTLTLEPERRYRRYVKRAKRVRSRLEVRFTPAGSGRTLVARRTVSFTS